MAGQMNRVQLPLSSHPAHHPGLPGGGGQCDEQGLEDTTDEDNGVLFGNEEVEQGQDEEAMDHQPTHYGDRIEAQLLSDSCGVIHLQDLAGDEEHNAEREVPGAGWGQAASSGPGRQGSQAALPLPHCPLSLLGLP